MTIRKKGAGAKPTPPRRPAISDEAIARLKAMSPARPQFTVGDVIHRLKRAAPVLPSAAPVSTATPPRNPR